MPSPSAVPVASPSEIRKRAAAYVAAVPPAIQGQGGDAHTYRLAATLVVDFALTPDEALALLRPWNASCQPPWSERDLAKKIKNAQRYGTHARGAKLAESRPKRTAFDTAEEVLGALLGELVAPLDPVATARHMAELGVFPEPPPTLADEIRGRKSALSWLLAEADILLPWRRPVRKGRPNPGLIPREHRGAALLAAVGAYLDLGDPPGGPERLAWIMEEAARQHFGCHPPRSAARDEIRLSDAVMRALANPLSRDGHARTAPASEKPESARTATAGRIAPCTQLPEDPETIVARQEAVAMFRESLSPQEQAVFDHPFSEAERVVAARVGTTWKTVHSTRGRIRHKARVWAASSEAEAS